MTDIRNQIIFKTQKDFDAALAVFCSTNPDGSFVVDYGKLEPLPILAEKFQDEFNRNNVLKLVAYALLEQLDKEFEPLTINEVRREFDKYDRCFSDEVDSCAGLVVGASKNYKKIREFTDKYSSEDLDKLSKEALELAAKTGLADKLSVTIRAWGGLAAIYDAQIYADNKSIVWFTDRDITSILGKLCKKINTSIYHRAAQMKFMSSWAEERIIDIDSAYIRSAEYYENAREFFDIVYGMNPFLKLKYRWDDKNKRVVDTFEEIQKGEKPEDIFKKYEEAGITPLYKDFLEENNEKVS